MIIKIKSRKKPTYRQLLEYILNEKSVAHNGFVLTHNLRGKNIDEWIEEYKQNENYRQRKRSDSVYLFHEILSWHKDDAKEITLEKLEDMAREYIKLRNPGGMYVAVPHYDKSHIHIHICASGIDYRQGKSLRLEKKDLQLLKKNIQQYQIEKYPELSKSIVNYEKSSKKALALSDMEYQIKQRTGRATNREEVIEVLKNYYKKAKSPDNFFELIKELGMESYMRGGKVSGVVWKNKKYRLNRIGLAPEVLRALTIGINRQEELKKVRKRGKLKGRER